MLTLFDPRFTVEYTQEERLVIYCEGKEIVNKRIPGLIFQDDLKREAIRLLNSKYTPHRYYTLTEIAEIAGVTKQGLSFRLPDMIHGLHYIKGGGRTATVLITEEGRRFLIEYYANKRTPE